MSTIHDVVFALLAACEYMHETEYMVALCRDLLNRMTVPYTWTEMRKSMCTPCAWTSDVNKIFSVLVLLYGQYRVNPESGWITEYNKHELREAIMLYQSTLKEGD